MKSFMKTVISAIQSWVKSWVTGKIKDSTADWNQNDSSANSYVKNRTHYVTPSEYMQVEFVENDKSGITTVKIGSTPVEWAENNSYEIFVDGVEYTFDGMASKHSVNAWENDTLYYIGAEYFAFNSSMDFSSYPFCFVTVDFTNIYAVFEDGTANHTVEFLAACEEVHQLDEKFIPDSIARTAYVENEIDDIISKISLKKMDATNPVGTGSFSMNRKSGTTVGDYSHAEGQDTTASGYSSHAEGDGTTASGYSSHAEGYNTTASGLASHAEGQGTTASGLASHAEGYNTIANRPYLCVIGKHNVFNDDYSIIEDTIRTSYMSKTNHYGCEILDNYTLDIENGNFIVNVVDTSLLPVKKIHIGTIIVKEYTVDSNGVARAKEILICTNNETHPTNIEYRRFYFNRIRIGEPTLTQGQHVFVVGNGTSDTARSNAHTLDWDGNAWYQGEIYVGGTGQDDATARLLKTSETATDDNILDTLSEMSYIDPIAASDGSIYTNKNGEIYIL